MVKGPLVDTYIRAGQELLNYMTLAGLQRPSLAAWLYDSETDRWTFFIASPQYDSLGTRTYLELMLNNVFKTFSERVWPIELADLRLASPNDPFARSLNLVRQASPTHPLRFTGVRVGDQYLEDAL